MNSAASKYIVDTCAAKAAMQIRMSEVRREYVAAADEADSLSKLPAMSVSFDAMCNLRERMARLGGYLAALEFALDELKER